MTCGCTSERSGRPARADRDHPVPAATVEAAGQQSEILGEACGQGAGTWVRILFAPGCQHSSGAESAPPHARTRASAHRQKLANCHARAGGATQPVCDRLVRLLRAGGNPLHVRGGRWMAAPATPASAMEGMEATASTVPQPAAAGHSSAEGPRVGKQRCRLLAHGKCASIGQSLT